MEQGDNEGNQPSEAAKLILTGLLAWLLRCGSACGSNVPVVISLLSKPRFSQSPRSICSFVRQTPVLLRERLMQSSSSGLWESDVHADLLKISVMTEEMLLLEAACFNAAQRPCVSDIIQDRPCVDCTTIA